VSRNGGRKLLYSPQYIAGFARAYREARRDLDDMHHKHLTEMAALRRELDSARAEFEELRDAVLSRQRAEQELTGLYRERAIQRAQAVERDPAQPLQ
jgi:Skp family chaperone for outer membrane proteins